MKYDKEWLSGVHRTKDIIKGFYDDVIREVPFPHRPVIKQQLDALSADFNFSLSGACDTEKIECKIAELYLLALELIEDEKKQQAAFAVPTFNGQ